MEYQFLNLGQMMRLETPDGALIKWQSQMLRVKYYLKPLSVYKNLRPYTNAQKIGILVIKLAGGKNEIYQKKTITSNTKIIQTF
jgi:hypothetical protein